MPRFVLERTLGQLSAEQLDGVADESKRLREERFPEITWEHSHVVRTADGLKSFCIYAAPDEESVRGHAEALGVPLDGFYRIETDLRP